MERRPLPGPAFLLLVPLAAGCGAGVPTADASPTTVPGSTPGPALTSFEDYAVSACAAWDALFRAVGNPDTAAGSDLSKALDAAVEAKDGPEAARLASEITAELESGRRAAAVAGTWPPGAPAMVQMDRILLAFEAMVAAKAAVAAGAPGTIEPQAAFEQAGGVAAYFAWIDAVRARPDAGAPGSPPCPGLPLSP